MRAHVRHHHVDGDHAASGSGEDVLVQIDRTTAVATRVGSLPAMIDHGRTGLLIDAATDLLAFAEAVCTRVGMLRAGTLVVEGSLFASNRAIGFDFFGFGSAGSAAWFPRCAAIGGPEGSGACGVGTPGAFTPLSEVKAPRS